MTAGNKKIIAFAVVALFTVCLAAGIARNEIPDVISNARILCFSCIGLK